MSTHNDDEKMKIEKKRDKQKNKTIIREADSSESAPRKKGTGLRSLFHGKTREAAEAPVEKEVENSPQKRLFLLPEEQKISKDHDDSLIVSEEKKIKLRPRKEEPAPEPVPEKPRSNYLLHISPDKSEALLMVYKRPEGPYTEKEIIDFLHANGITHGIQDTAVNDIVNGTCYYEDVVIAKGTSPREGRDGFYEFHFNPNPETRPIVMADGSVDYNTLGKVELVVRDQLLVTYHKAIPSRDGMDITGTTIPVKESIDLPKLHCKNCELDENQYEYYATAEGNVTYEDSVLAVTPMYVVEGDLEAATGDVNFHGDVLVRGNVFANVTIQTTGSITIDGHVEVANLFAGKDVLLKNGMQGSGIGKISAKGNVLAKFLEQTHVYAGNEISTNALLNCDVEAGNSIVVTGKRGSIIGGTTVAAERITAFSLGNRVGVNTKIVVGLEKEFKVMMDELDAETDECSQKLRDAEMALDRIAYQQRTNPNAADLSTQRTEMMRAKILYQSQLSELNTKRGHLMDINQRASEGEIVITGPAYGGCHIIINGISESLKSECKDVTFTKGRREIRILSNKLK